MAENEKEVNVKVSGPPQAAKLEAIEELIRGFNESTAKLQGAYASLQEKFERINLELEESNRELSASLAEKDKLSRYLTDILESLTSGVLVLNLSGKITLMNKRAEYIIDRNPLEVIGEDYFDIMGFETPVELTPIETLKTRKAIEGEKTIQNANGRNIPVSFATSLVTDHEGDIIGVVESFRDISEVKRLEQEVSRMDTLAALGQMAATVAHEIRNPLGGIAGFANLLERDLEPDDNRRRLVKKIIEGVEQINLIISSVLSYNSKLNLNPREIDLTGSMDELLILLKQDLGESNGSKIGFTVSQPSEPVTVEVDVRHLNLALFNIFWNAIDAIEGEGNIDIRIIPGQSQMSPSCTLSSELLGKMRKSSRILKSRRPCSMILVTDSGAGMDEDTLKNLFVPFFTTKEKGIGLGLASARKIIDAHHGEIWIESTLNLGTAVGIILPSRSTVL